ncbi:CTD small phosphatase-like protein 2 isoform X1 [Ananas comosus]|uniref:CTD small phosphatase-like protein 2 n=2 Tax=Ananas comosus TaxID=4615 RepID=A0A199V4T2_ANACO|nr:CTD small phosphatase-like protein 2 isoform X1 [Ananas comosus]XP_020103160.1 CTD small phosphatase-like protein 2 isoform X1 [Ananas comosus]XP_020103165.1 CTD small phosphatase-like protein 2 isoform X1 [Ananas comosus]XP_020103174.1 CTD small phosphatase-like protein 2 isoform X1 [Ananas comosus]OAY72064.1 CTD small phosphatase-like protein 2 [Ananas comosus]
MQTRKKVLARNASREYTNSRSCRQPKKVTSAAEKKVSDLITSSAKKQKSVAVRLSKKNGIAEVGRNLTSGCDVTGENEGVCPPKKISLDHKKSGENAAECVRGSIFSPPFHHPKESSDDVQAKVDSVNSFKGKDQLHHNDCPIEEASAHSFVSFNSSTKQKINVENKAEDGSENPKFHGLNHAYAVHMESDNAISSLEDEFSALGNISSEVSAIYIAMQHSKLECIDEQSQDSMSTEDCVDPDETDDFDDFDPYSFIKDLPDLSVVVPKFRPMLLPKQTRSCPSTTLVLDLDETLVHSTLEPCGDADFNFLVNFNLKEHTIYVRCRPYLKDFLERVASLFETIIFTASQSIYAEQLLNVLDPKRKLFRHRVYRESCVFVEGNYLKDLSILGRDLARVIIVDNSPQAFGFQIDNGVPIESWFDDPNDRELLLLLPFLESLVGVDDVRPLIASKFNLREKVAAATCLPIDFRS